MKSLLDKGFTYKPSYDTDIRERFDEVRVALKAELEVAEALAKEKSEKVKPIIRGKVNGR